MPRLYLALAGLLLPSIAFACLWDYDTLLQERSRFPDTLELITGKFLRHSQEFYYWRIQDRLEKLRHDPDNLSWYDDLAVAYDKTSQHDLAIQTMLDKDKKKPGLYETEANLGTFYIHAGQLDKGLKHIGRAIEINPDAHFGREKYQKLLVEYVLSRRRDGKTPLPLADTAEPGRGVRYTTFTAFLLRGKKQAEEISQPERKAAIKGVLGMMRFGNHESPVLLEALGNLLSQFFYENPEGDAKRLAARACLKASYGVSDDTAKQAYRAIAKTVLEMQLRKPSSHDPLPLEELETEFQQELAEAKDWYETVRQNELAWIREGKDPEQEFSRLYYQEPQLSITPEETSLTERKLVLAITAAVAVCTALVVLSLFVWKRMRPKRSTPAASTAGTTQM